MPRIPREFVPLDMNYMRDPRIRRAGPDAEHLFIRSLAHCKSGGTEGFVGAYDLDIIAIGLRNIKPRVSALVREGLWTEVDGGWLVTKWAKWNMSQDEIAEAKEKRREGAIKTNHNKLHVNGNRDPDCPLCSVNGSPHAPLSAVPAAIAHAQAAQR